MAWASWLVNAAALPGTPGAARVSVDARQWRAVAAVAREAGAVLLALWARPTGAAGPAQAVSAAYLHGAGVLVAELAVTTSYPDLSAFHPAAARMQRAVRDLNALDADTDDRRPWLRHAPWERSVPPLLGSRPPDSSGSVPLDAYTFRQVRGEGVHEIAVGPVHAGIIEPGHFRFSVVGEKVLKLEQRLGYVHKGIERRFTELEPLQAHRLAARVCGDSAVAHAWAYCQAVEALCGCTVPPRAACLRAVCLEFERIANHLGDLGALGNDAGFAFGLARFGRLKERLLRCSSATIGWRYLLDAVIPGGVAFELTAAAAASVAEALAQIAREVVELRRIYAEHAGLRDRFVDTGRVTPALAAELGLVGLVGRASGQARDLRVDLPVAPYTAVAVRKCGSDDGDVAARVALRFDELAESCRLLCELLAALPPGAVCEAPQGPPAGGLAIGLVESWRGPVMYALDCDHDGRIARCHPHDPSWQNWPALEYAVIGNIVPDFPLINKSFNLSYSGHDL